MEHLGDEESGVLIIDETGFLKKGHKSVGVVGSILWVARSGSSWREMPEEYGKWESAYRRYELWSQGRVCGSASSKR